MDSSDPRTRRMNYERQRLQTSTALLKAKEIKKRLRSTRQPNMQSSPSVSNIILQYYFFLNEDILP